MDIKEAIEKGVSEEELRAKLEKEIKDAYSSIEKEKKEKEYVADARINFVDALTSYIDAMGWVDCSGVNIGELAEMLKNLEPELNNYVKVMKVLNNNSTNIIEEAIKKSKMPTLEEREDKIDKILEKFLEDLV